VHGDDADVDATDAAGSDGADAATDGSNTADGGAGATAESVDDADAESVDGVDTEHVMNLTFVLTLLLGVPAVVVLSLFVPLDGWNEILAFVVRVGAAIWFLTAVTLYVRERLRN
jgi:hypothetical protein